MSFAATMHTSTIIDALKTLIGTTAGVAEHSEGIPLPWPDDAALPSCRYRFEDFNQKRIGGHYEQNYLISIYAIFPYDGATYNTAYGRGQVELIANKIMTDIRMGLTNLDYVSIVRRVVADNDLEMIFRADRQPRQCFRIEVLVQKSEHA